MSILINLLPDLRQAKLRQHRRRQMALGISVIIWGVCGAVVVVQLLISASQNVAIKLHSDSINTNTQKLKEVSGLLDALTTQQHLAALPQLYSQRVLYSKFFEAYAQSDPLEVTLDSLAVDQTNNLVVSGKSTSYRAVATLAVAMQELNLTVGDEAAAGNTPYFSKVTITDTTSNDGRTVLFGLTATVSPEVFSGK